MKGILFFLASVSSQQSSCNIQAFPSCLTICTFVPCLSPLCSLSAKESESSSQWKLCFKLYCLLDADSISVDSIEYLFLYEQVMKQPSSENVLL